MSLAQALAGVLAPAGMARYSDLAAFSAAGQQLVRLRCRVNPVSDLARWQDAGATHFILQLLSPTPARRPTTPEAFVDAFAGEIEAFLRAGVSVVEIHDEPNRVDRGLTVSWQGGAAFSIWFEEVVRCLHRRYGYGLKIGFPALFSSDQPHPDRVGMDAQPNACDSTLFLSQCGAALECADWVGLHLYWRTLAEMRAFEGAMRFLHEYLDRYPAYDFIVTDFAHVGPDALPAERGRQYAELLILLAQYDRILGACGSPLRSSDPCYRRLGWVDVDGTAGDTVTELSRRPLLPDPERVWLSWPTTSRCYTRVFGEDPQAIYGDFGIVGGHNGVDLGVDPKTGDVAPIFAALDGTVSQVALDHDGYGYHVRVQSYGPEQEEITLLYAHLAGIEVSVGMLVSRGDLLGHVSTLGDASSAHLHMGMRVSGVDLPVTRGWLNPRPYLEAASRLHFRAASSKMESISPSS